MSIYTLSSLYSADEPFSINKNFESLGETRNVAELILSTNRDELKDKIEQTIFESSIRNSSLKLLRYPRVFQKAQKHLITNF